jgi:hypothetical protein
MKWTRRVLPVVAMLGIMTCSSVRAEDVLVGNLDQGIPPSMGGPFYDVIQSMTPGDPTSGFTAAQEFTPGLAGETLTRVFASLGGYDVGDGTFTLTAQLFANDPTTNLPTGALLTTFTFNPATIPPPPTGADLPTFANVELDPTNPVSLDPTKGYWVVLSGSSNDGSGSTYWQWTTSNVHSGPGDLPHYANMSGGQWNGPFPSPGQDNEPYMIQVNGVAAVPEPASWVLGCMGFTAILGASRWASSRCRVA